MEYGCVVSIECCVGCRRKTRGGGRSSSHLTSKCGKLQQQCDSFFLSSSSSSSFSATARNCRGNSLPGKDFGSIGTFTRHRLIQSHTIICTIRRDASVLLLLAAGVRSPSLPRRGLLHVRMKRNRQCVLGLGSSSNGLFRIQLSSSWGGRHWECIGYARLPDCYYMLGFILVQQQEQQ